MASWEKIIKAAAFGDVICHKQTPNRYLIDKNKKYLISQKSTLKKDIPKREHRRFYNSNLYIITMIQLNKNFIYFYDLNTNGELNREYSRKGSCLPCG